MGAMTNPRPNSPATNVLILKSVLRVISSPFGLIIPCGINQFRIIVKKVGIIFVH
jgi:hypothetical protein